MAVRSRRLFGPTAVPSAAYTLVYTCPAGRTAVFRRITIYHYGVAASTPVLLAVNGTTQDHVIMRADWVGSRTFPAATQNAVSTMAQREQIDEIVLNPGDSLYVQTTAGTAVVAGFGALLDGAPS